MPPRKGKKPSSSSSSPSSAARSTPSSRHDAGAAEEEEELRLRSQLSRAAAIFPNLMTESALVGRIVESSEDQPPERGAAAKLWLSEATMLSASLFPGSLVSVSLAAAGSASGVASPPLQSFVDVLLGDSCVDDASIDRGKIGSFFAFATLFPSRKVMKNGVRLSHHLSVAMGFPSINTSVYVSALKSSTLSTIRAENDWYSGLQIHSCKDLHLKLVPTDAEKMGVPKMVSLGSSEVKGPLSLKYECSTTSPRTPVFHTKEVSSSHSSPMPSSVPKELMSCASGDMGLSFLTSVFEDEKTMEMLRVFACQRLLGRHLIAGNFVSLPVCGRLCIFYVETAKSLDLMSQENHDFVCVDGQMPILLDPVDAIFVVNTKTQVTISQSAGSEVDYSVKIKPRMERLPRNDAGDDLRVKKSQLGGLSKEFGILKQVIHFSVMQKGSPLRFSGVLLHGPPGTGKTSLASACVRDAGANLFVIDGPEIVSEYYGESEQTLQNIFDSARRDTPAVIFIDELDALAPARKEGGEELSLRIVATLLTLMDGMFKADGVLVIAATNRLDSIDPALRRPGRFDKEIEIGVPSPVQRLEILIFLLDEMYHSIDEKEIQSLAMSTHGFVGADLAALCQEAASIALRRWIHLQGSVIFSSKHPNENPYVTAELPTATSSSVVQRTDGLSSVDQVNALSLSLKQLSIPNDLPRQSGEAMDICGELFTVTNGASDGDDSLLKITADDFRIAKSKVRPSAMREVMLEFPNVRWEDVGGQAEVKRQLIEAVQWPQMCPDAFIRIGIRPPRGLLMFGPPGCSKTLLARAVASEAKLNFLAVKGPELFSKWVGDSEKAIRNLFAKARDNSPSIIFFDEIDGLATTRGNDHDGTSVGDRVLSQLLVELDGLDQRSGVVVIAATNRPDKIDPALLRPGRFDRHLDVKPPDELDREAIFRIHVRDMPCGPDVTAKDLARLTNGYTGADIKLVCRGAAIAALEENWDAAEIYLKHFQDSIRRVRPSDVESYMVISEKFKRYVDSSSGKP